MNEFSSPLLLAIFGILFNEQAHCQMICKDIVSNSVSQQLKEYLFCSYDSEIRPTEKYRNATVVHYGLYVSMFTVDELSKHVDFHVWARMMWNDPRLSWKPSEYDNIQSLHVMSYEIWVPDLVMHSATSMGVDMEMPSISCFVHYNGVVYCVPSLIYTPSCDSDYAWWPYDTMNCTIHIASWAHSSDEIELHLSAFSTTGQLSTEDVQNSEWEVINTSQIEHKMDSKFGLDFSSDLVSFHILLKRHASMYSASYVTLAIVLMTMTLIALWLEPRSMERMIVANLNFVLHLLCVQDLQWKLPFNGARPPELILFYENSLVLATFALILTSILRYLQELHTDAPAWISSSTVSILRSRVGQIFLVSILDPKVSAGIEMNADDNTNLISPDKKESTWRYASILVGWIAFLSILFVYIIMLIVYLPTNRSIHSLRT